MHHLTPPSPLNQTSSDFNVTTSLLTYTADMSDSGKFLTCRATNPHIPMAAKEASLKLNVHCESGK